MCRHSGYFYERIARRGVLDSLIDRCEDVDRTTRKFACFAIGNAGFHSDALYPELRVAVPPLVRLLGDEEDKTRANAAAALGNLVRNSAALCGDLIRAGALERLVELATGPEAAAEAAGSGGDGGGGGGDKSGGGWAIAAEDCALLARQPVHATRSAASCCWRRDSSSQGGGARGIAGRGD